MNSGVQAGLVQLGIAGLLVVTWYSGAWQVIVDELVAGVTGSGRRLGAGLGSGGSDVVLGPPTPLGWAPPPPVGLRVPTATLTAPRAV